MKNHIQCTLNHALRLLAIAAIGLSTSCKYDNFVEGTYPDAAVYLPAAVSGVYNVSTVAATGAVRYAVDVNAKKFNIPLGVVRSGITTSGDLSANLVANNDTINKMIAEGKLVNTELLAAANYTIPTSATAESGKDVAPFLIAVNLDFLRSNPTKKFAIGVTIASSSTGVNPRLQTAIIVIDAQIVKPTAAFTSKVETKKVTFTNISTYGISYVWNFGDGSAVSNAANPIYNYTNAGTYTVKLTTTGITGSLDAVTKEMTVTVL